ncbi:hypothetical protein GCM10011492_09220 [Flexivirga endophytica]|uniref:Stress-response A/B barrel domain-containing protein n=1 Tax=Flexivirga endophytica TaxID=1849103 RepID=A0A916SXG4_9MICO|nr:Dabb family protein [Flexivirga endophytica]GGB21442.1 hypothetical protein GCM10011492_09220 [Flexivirga endophytica]GHB59102.1 hypothetical protein GCM10008112_30240 [Flexivirga endophytica]
MIRHVFAWKVAEGADNARAIELLKDFSTKVDVVRSFEIGAHTGDPGDNGDPWDGALITDFDDWADLDTYSDHPAHVELLGDLLPLLSERAVVDFVREA